MNFDEQLISYFLTGTVALFALVAIGGALANAFRTISRQFAFTKLALILGLPPFCLAKCVSRSSLSTLFLFAIIIIVLGFTIDGIRYLLLTWREPGNATTPAKKTQDGNSDGKGIVWDKAE